MTCRDWFGDAGDEHLFEALQEPEPSWQAAMKAIQACYDRAMTTCGEQARRINDLRKDLATMTDRAGEVAKTCLGLRHDLLLANKRLVEQERTIATLRARLDATPEIQRIVKEVMQAENLERLTQMCESMGVLDKNPITGVPRAVETEPYQELPEDHEARDDYPDLDADQALADMCEDLPDDCAECFYGPPSQCNSECNNPYLDQGGCMADPDPEFNIQLPGPYGSFVMKHLTQKDVDDLWRKHCATRREPEDGDVFWYNGYVFDRGYLVWTLRGRE